VRLRPTLLVLFTLALIWSVIRPLELFTWFLEVFPALIGVVLLIATRHRFPLTPLLCILLFLHALILIVGGHYTYAQVPLGFWMKDAFGFARNHYDRIGHLAQGFVPAIAAREILLRLGVVRKRGWLFFIVVSICLAISATYELFEWAVAIAVGAKGDSFLGTQGDVWDTQEDMAFALLGAIVAQLTLSRVHDRQIARMESAMPAP
jgi:putative membrane protein